MRGYGAFGEQCASMMEMAPGPIDLGCGAQFQQADEGCTECLNRQNNMNSACMRLDNRYMWTHRILPGVAVGLVVGYLIGKSMAK